MLRPTGIHTGRRVVKGQIFGTTEEWPMVYLSFSTRIESFGDVRSGLIIEIAH